MKKIVLLLFLVLFCLTLQAQKIKLFDSYLKLSDLTSRYIVVLEDNSIWWYIPGDTWKNADTKGLPENYDIKYFSAYSKTDGQTNYVVVLSDNSIWWFTRDKPWKKSSTQGLPAGYVVKGLNAYAKDDGTRFTVVLSDNSIWWCAPPEDWQVTTLEGLPK
jgi:hypothetical protein